MGVVIDFPKDRTQKIKDLEIKKKKVPSVSSGKKLNQFQSVTIQVPQVANMVTSIDAMNDTLKYVTDCIYDSTVCFNRLRKILYFIGFILVLVLIKKNHP
jgi:hypothetical protein